MKAHYATTTPFYGHVVRALKRNYDDLTLQRRFQLDEDTFNRLAPVLPRSLRATLERRVQPAAGADRALTLRRWSYEPALYARLGRRMSLPRYRSLIRSTADEVRKRAKRADVLQFTDGIGYLALRRGEFALSVMERRHVHHSLLQAPLDTWDGFPVAPVREPIPDILDEEYELADVIVTYSEAARASFLARDFKPEKVVVAHLGVTPLPPPTRDVPRDPYLAIYVGRGDADKGIDVAVGAIEHLGGPHRLAVAGPLTREAQEWLTRYRNVDYLGILGRAELAELYARATLMLLPSIESFGLAMTDAASAGVRVLCMDTAGIGPELGTEISRVLTTRDVGTWAEVTIEEFEAETDDRRAARVSNGSLVERFSWGRSEDAMSELHRRLRG